MKKHMKSYRIYGPLDMRLEDIDVPTLGDDEVLIKVSYTGICTTDIELYDGSMPYFEQGLSKRPMTAGHEWSGTVAEVGINVSHLHPGDLVVGDISVGCGKCVNCLKGEYHLCAARTELGVIRLDGSMAEYLKSDGKNVYKVPPGVSAREAALVEPLATVLYAVRRTHIDPGDSVVVFGDGPIGLLNAQLANHCGASRVVVVGLKDTHGNKIESWGLTFVNSSDKDAVEAVESVLGEAADVVFEDTGNAEAFESAVKCVKPGGRVCALSITGTAKNPIDMDYVVTRDISIIGVLASPNSFIPALKMIAAGKIDVAGCVSHEYSFEEAVDAFEFVRTSKDRMKVLVKGV